MVAIRDSTQRRRQNTTPPLQEGRLFDIQTWMASSKSLHVPPELNSPRSRPQYGFHTLVELLARHEQSQELKNRALRHAVSLKRLDFIELLVSWGDQLRSVPFVRVLRVWHPAIIRYFSLRQKNPRSFGRGEGGMVEEIY